MPVILARYRSPCVVCSTRIEPNEAIDYTLEVGPRHLTCADREGTRRVNRYRTECSLCGVALAKGAALLELVERREGDAFVRSWVASCLDLERCDARIKATTH